MATAEGRRNGSRPTRKCVASEAIEPAAGGRQNTVQGTARPQRASPGYQTRNQPEPRRPTCLARRRHRAARVFAVPGRRHPAGVPCASSPRSHLYRRQDVYPPRAGLWHTVWKFTRPYGGPALPQPVSRRASQSALLRPCRGAPAGPCSAKPATQGVEEGDTRTAYWTRIALRPAQGRELAERWSR
jgi:hypothetical protein